MFLLRLCVVEHGLFFHGTVLLIVQARSWLWTLAFCRWLEDEFCFFLNPKKLRTLFTPCFFWNYYSWTIVLMYRDLATVLLVEFGFSFTGLFSWLFRRDVENACFLLVIGEWILLLPGSEETENPITLAFLFPEPSFLRLFLSSLCRGIQLRFCLLCSAFGRLESCR